jgi:hypothetical protein
MTGRAPATASRLPEHHRDDTAPGALTPGLNNIMHSQAALNGRLGTDGET